MISVIVPVYNVEDYLHYAMESLENQTYKDMEVLLVDDRVMVQVSCVTSMPSSMIG